MKIYLTKLSLSLINLQIEILSIMKKDLLTFKKNQLNKRKTI